MPGVSHVKNVITDNMAWRTVFKILVVLTVLLLVAECRGQQRSLLRRLRYTSDPLSYAFHDDDEIVEGRKIYKNPRNAPSESCPRDEEAIIRTGRTCLRKCSADADCLSRKKVCLCDGICGLSCIKPDKECGELDNPMFGNVEVKSRVVGSKAQYRCQEGYHLIGQEERQCQANGIWTATPPECRENLYCTDPPVFPNARHNGLTGQTRFEVNKTLAYSCYEGYITTGFDRAKCLLYNNTMQWFGPEIHCEPKICGDPGEIPNGFKEGSCFAFSCRVTYHCRPGFELVGRNTYYCQHDGTWNPKELPTCNPVQCEIPENPENGKAIFIAVSYNAVVSYECNYSYMIVGSSTRRCGPDKKWSGVQPQCKQINCGHPGHLSNGWLENYEQGTALGSSIIFRCYPNMTIEGDQSTVCQADGTWSKPPPMCLAPCIVPSIEFGVIKNKTRTGAQVPHGTVIDVQCNEKYELTYSLAPSICYNGTWTHYPRCQAARCKKLPRRPRHGMVIAPRTDHGMRARYRCKDGYKLEGPTTTECDYGNWTGTTPKCREVYCPFPGELPNGRVLLVGNMGMYDYRSYVKRVRNNRQIRFACNKGFLIVSGPPGATCVAGRWSPNELPRCEPDLHPRIHWIKRSVNISEYEEGINQTTLEYPLSISSNSSSISISSSSSSSISSSSGGSSAVEDVTEDLGEHGSEDTDDDDEEEDEMAEAVAEEKDETLTDEELEDEIINENERPIGWSMIPSSTTSTRTAATAGTASSQTLKPEATSYVSQSLHIRRILPPTDSSSSFMHSSSSSSSSPPPPPPSHSYDAVPKDHSTSAPSAEILPGLHHPVDRGHQDHLSNANKNALNLSKRLRGPLVDFYRLLRIENSPHEFEKSGRWPSLKRVPRNVIDEKKKEKKDKKHKRRNKWKKKGKNVPHCADIPIEQYLRVEVLRPGRDDNYTYSAGARVKVTCLHGYGLNIGNRTAKCAKGKWKPMKPECITLPCSVPEASHGQFEFNGAPIAEKAIVSHGEVVKFSCQSGYNVLGSETMRCWYGAWAVTGKNPECQPDPCVLPELNHGKYTFGYKKGLTIIHGAKVDYTCDEGWFLNVTEVSCYLGVLRPAPPACVVPGQATDIINNSEPAPVKRGGSNGGDITIVDHSLHKKPCRPPTPVPGATIFKNGHTLAEGEGDETFPDGTKVVFSCSTNNIGEKNTWDMKCVDGNWEGLRFPNSCGADGADEEENFGNRTCLWRKTEPNVVTFYNDQEITEEMVEFEPGAQLVSRCVDIGKYALVGDTHRRCVDGVWSGEKPVCFGLNQENDYSLDKAPTILFRNERGPMAQSNDGKLVVYPGTVLHLECLFMRRHGTPKWNVSLSSTVIKGKKKRRKNKMKGGKGAGKAKNVGSMVPYPNGWANAPNRDMQLEYRLSIYKAAEKDSGAYACVTPTGLKHTVTLDIKAVICKPIDELKKPEETNLKYEPTDDVRMNTIVQFRCEPGSSLVGSPSIKCLPSANWSAPVPRCENIECPDPRVKLSDSRLRVTVLSRGVGGRVLFTCPKGYTTTGPSRAICLDNGQWSSPTPTCKEAKCAPPIPPENGMLSGKGPYHSGDVVEVKCNSNYMMEGQPMMVCQEDGQWSDEVPKCSLACTYPGTIISGTMSSIKFYYPINDDITYTCSSGFVLRGARSIVCKEGGQWSAPVPSCMPRQP
ncbi:sushi, von Willebrand factor type A, EGF and pentraxin domain-containing protein 1-like isoform X2 [Macrobrachium rosenbergii]|uniref:sushi, von Willebrand factor type A, EGF and pentraxin domain-containing protein 1-like isoform X2 n=1 Tax=Macrobrachium rosenbergii TaxID=79674 RepID=UPI0034D4940F